jgi:hypothetical protein
VIGEFCQSNGSDPCHPRLRGNFVTFNGISREISLDLNDLNSRHCTLNYGATHKDWINASNWLIEGEKASGDVPFNRSVMEA